MFGKLIRRTFDKKKKHTTTSNITGIPTAVVDQVLVR